MWIDKHCSRNNYAAYVINRFILLCIIIICSGKAFLKNLFRTAYSMKNGAFKGGGPPLLRTPIATTSIKPPTKGPVYRARSLSLSLSSVDACFCLFVLLHATSSPRTSSPQTHRLTDRRAAGQKERYEQTNRKWKPGKSENACVLKVETWQALKSPSLWSQQ